MGDPLRLVAGGGLLVLFAGATVTNIRRERDLAAMAALHQWELTKKDRRLPETFGGRPFADGHDRVGRIVMRGRYQNRAILVVDHAFKTPGSDGDDTHSYWAACVEDLPAALPALEVVPRKSRADRHTTAGILTRAPEFQRGDPAFDRRYRVVATNPLPAADLLDAEVLRLLAGWPDFSWRVEGTRLLTWGGGTVKPHWVQTCLNMLVALAETIPEEVWRTARG
jgi:hypothetical protein